MNIQHSRDETLQHIQANIKPLTPGQLEQQEKRKQAWIQDQAAEILDKSGAPLRHLKHKLELVELKRGQWGVSFKSIMDLRGKGFLVALVGNRGNGKTQMAVELMRLCAQQGSRCYYLTATQFFLEIKGTYRRESSRSEVDVIRDYTQCPFLVIDEFGQRSETPWEDRLLFEVINERYNRMLDTLIISNQEPNAFLASIGPSLASRMKETGGIMHCTWASFR